MTRISVLGHHLHPSIVYMPHMHPHQPYVCVYNLSTTPMSPSTVCIPEGKYCQYFDVTCISVYEHFLHPLSVSMSHVHP
jgi:hypothetical protein